MMIEEYKKELEDLEKQMINAEKFAEKLPIFSSDILCGKLQSDANYIKLGSTYKTVYFGWGIKRGLYKTGTNRTVTNYKNDNYEEFLFNIYINTLSMYDSHENLGLDEICKNTPVFFYDCLNSTFYATDDQIVDLLEALVTWYDNAIKQIGPLNKKKQIAELKAKLDKLESD